jgi:hypothetical protein
MLDDETKIFDEPAQPRGKLRRMRPTIANGIRRIFFPDGIYKKTLKLKRSKQISERSVNSNYYRIS